MYSFSKRKESRQRWGLESYEIFYNGKKRRLMKQISDEKIYADTLKKKRGTCASPGKATSDKLIQLFQEELGIKEARRKRK